VPLSGELLDSIDDELFSTDYRSPSQLRHLTLLPEPPTVRLSERAGSPRPRYVPAEVGPWLSVAYPASEYSGEENATEIVLLVGIAVLLVVAVASTGVILWWL
jgi:hypothetical protein